MSFDESVKMENSAHENVCVKENDDPETNDHEIETNISTQHVGKIIRIPNRELAIPDTTPKSYVFQTQNVQGLKREINIKIIIAEMINNGIDIYCVQETWLEGNWEEVINDYLFIHHGVSKCSCKRGNRGVGIILSPHMQTCYNRINKGNKDHSSMDIDNVDRGTFLSIKLEINSSFRLYYGAFRRKQKKNKVVCTKLKICSIYMPVDEVGHFEMLDYVYSKLSTDPDANKFKVVIGQDSNAQVVTNEMYEDDACPAIG